MGDLPWSEYADSLSGDDVCFLVKKDVNLPPGVKGFLTSAAGCDLADEADSERKGGGRAPGVSAMSSSITVSCKEALG